MPSINELKREIDLIKERNKRVEADKAWETSLFRRVLISALTYLVVVSIFYVAGLPNPLINAIIPAMAFIISSLSLPFFKAIWTKYFLRTKSDLKTKR